MIPISRLSSLYRNVWVSLFGMILFIFTYQSVFSQKPQIPEYQRYLDLGEESYASSDFNKAEGSFYKAFKIAEQEKNYEVMTIALNNIANAQSSKGKIEDAINTYLQSLQISKSIQNHRLTIRILSNIGILYEYQNDTKSALDYYQQALPLAVETSDSLALADLYNNIGVIEEINGNYSKALALYILTLKITEAKGIFDRVALVSNNMGLVYKNSGDEKNAEVYFQKGLEYSIKSGYQWCEAAVYTNLGNLRLQKGQIKEAIYFLTKALDLSRKIGANEILVEAYESLSKVYKSSGNYALAFEFLSKHQSLKDSIMGAERMAQIVEMKEKYEAEEKENKIRILEQQKVLDDLTLAQRNYELSRQSTYWTIGIFMIFIFVLIGWLLYNQKVLREKSVLNMALLKSENDRKEAVYQTEKAERVRIARDMHDELGSGLSKISVISQMMSANLTDNHPLKGDLNKLSSTAIELVQGMSDLVWALNPENANLQVLIIKMKEFTYDFLGVSKAKWNATFPEEIPNVSLSQELQRNLYLCYKESLNNIVKHAEAEQIDILVRIEGQIVAIEIIDNGKGFEIQELSGKGNGLKNLKQRMDNVGGMYKIESNPGKGTKVMISANFVIDEN